MDYIESSWKGTCSIDNPKEDHVTFARNWKNFYRIWRFKESIFVVVSEDIVRDVTDIPDNISVLVVDQKHSVDYVFTRIHNLINSERCPLECQVSPSVYLGDGVVIGASGLKIIKDSQNRLICFKHMGNVIIEKDVIIEANTVIHRGCLDSTIIQENVMIGSLCNIGHNCIVGNSSILTTHVSLGGGVKIGRRCWIGMSASIKQKVSICDDVLIGMGSVVLNDITKPGVYFGIPARYKGVWNGEWTSK